MNKFCLQNLQNMPFDVLEKLLILNDLNMKQINDRIIVIILSYHILRFFPDF